MKEIILELTNLYFSAFKNKDLKLLEDLYSEDIILIDWTGQWYGKESVIMSNSELFSLEYDLLVIDNTICENKSYNTLNIRFDDGPIDVLDILYFNDENKLYKIRAYKG